MLNNKGQSLVLFIVLLPVLLLFMALVVDLGAAYNLKNDIDNSLELVIEYGLDNYSEDGFDRESINKMLKYNIPSSKNDLVIENDKLIITSNDSVGGVFARVLNINIFKVESKYMGYLDDDKYTIGGIIAVLLFQQVQNSQ